MPYIFRPPAASYDLPFTFAALDAWINRGRLDDERRLGATLRFVRWGEVTGAISVNLYDTTIATLYGDGCVFFHEAIDNHGSQATTYWLQKILTDNDYPGLVRREKGRYTVAGRSFWPATDRSVKPA